MPEASSSTPATTTATTEQPHESGGLPQFDFTQWPGQILWFVIIFGILMLLMSRWFVPRIGGTIEGREDRISGDIAEARRLKDEAEAQSEAAAAETAQARAASRQVAADARAKAQAEIAASLAAEDAKLAQTAAEADARITAARDAALGNVRSIGLETAQAIIERLTGRPASIQEVEAAAGQA